MKKKKIHKQKYEYLAVTITNKNSIFDQVRSAVTSTTNIVIHTTRASMLSIINDKLQEYAELGWQFKSDFRVDEEIMLIFEKYHDEYENYNDELYKFINK